MAPPLSTALMQSRPLLDPVPHTIVAPLILSNPLFHKCRISDHLHLVFQWGIHTDLLSKREVALFTNVYTPPAQARMLRKHEGHPARAPDGTIMEIQGDACPGNTGESVGPWDLGNVHMCEGYAEWSAGLSQTLNMALAAGLKIEEVNMPQPNREELEKAQETSSQWLHGRPLHPSIRKNLAAHRDGIRDKLDAFLTFVDVQIKSETRKEAVFLTLKEALGTALAGKEVGEYNGVLGGMVNKIIDRIEDFIEYMEERIDVSETKQQRTDDVREVIDVALKGKQKRKRDDQDDDNSQAQKKAMTADAKVKTEENLTTELAEAPRPRKRERKAKMSVVRKREAKKTKDDNSALEKSKGNDKQNGGVSMSKEGEAAAEEHIGTKDKAEKSDTFEKGLEMSKSGSFSVNTVSSPSAAKPKEVEAETEATRPKSYATSSRDEPAGIRQPGTPPPPYSQHASPSPIGSKTKEQTARRTSVPDQTPQRATSSAESRSITPTSTLSEESAMRKFISPAAQILEKIHNAGKRRSESLTKESTLMPTSATPSPENKLKDNTASSDKFPDTILSTASSEAARDQHTETEDEDEEESLFLPLKEAETLFKEKQKQLEAIAAEEEKSDDADSPFEQPNASHRQSSYDLELPPPPETRLGSSKMPIDIDLFFPCASTSSSSKKNHEYTSIFGGTPVKIKSESSSSNYIEIKDEDDDDFAVDVDVIKGLKGAKQEVMAGTGGGQKGVGVKKEADINDDDDCGEVLLCSRDEWVREVKKKHDSQIHMQARIRQGGW